MPTLRVMTYNILYGGVGREHLIRSVVEAICPDLAVFTEVTAMSAFESIADAVGPHRAGHRGGAREHPVIVSRWPIIASGLHGPAWAPRKWVEATVRPDDGPPVTIHGVHLVPQPLWPFEVLRWLEVGALLEHVRGRTEGPQIVAGDFNALREGDTQRHEGAPVWVRAQWLLQGGTSPRWALRRLTRAGFIDCYRMRNPQAEGFTVPAWNPSARVDYVFASPDLEPMLRAAGTMEPSRRADMASPAPRRSLPQLLGWKAAPTLDGAASDHLPVWADFEFSAPP